nr:MAG TPA_asm: hypothetical protein [Bacteriophage sp.]
MQTISSAFERELRILIEERKKSLIENVVSGVAISTMDGYREAVGRISELNEVLDMFDDANANVSKKL